MDIAHRVDIVNVVGPLTIPAIVVKKTIRYYSLIDLTDHKWEATLTEAKPICPVKNFTIDHTRKHFDR